MTYKTIDEFHEDYQEDIDNINGTMSPRIVMLGDSKVGKTTYVETLLDKAGVMPQELDSTKIEAKNLGFNEVATLASRLPIPGYQQFCEGDPNCPIILKDGRKVQLTVLDLIGQENDLNAFSTGLMSNQTNMRISQMYVFTADNREQTLDSLMDNWLKMYKREEASIKRRAIPPAYTLAFSKCMLEPNYLNMPEIENGNYESARLDEVIDTFAKEGIDLSIVFYDLEYGQDKSKIAYMAKFAGKELLEKPVNVTPAFAYFGTEIDFYQGKQKEKDQLSVGTWEELNSVKQTKNIDLLRWDYSDD